MLRLKWTLAVALLISFGADANAADPPPLDRPSPPACCADGYCYPNPTVWGVYQTRWRRWPTDSLEPTPAQRPGDLVPEVDPFDRPPPEEEDRAAPPPTPAAQRAREEEEAEAATPRESETPGTTPLAPPGGLQLPVPPQPDRERPEIPTMRMPWETDDEPQTPPGTTGGPTGDADPPPTPPFAMPSLVDRPSVRPALQPANPPLPRRSVPASQSPGYDPPPLFPIAHVGQ
jgi:hypothetical protein